MIHPDGHAAVFEGFERTHTQPPAQVARPVHHVHLVARDTLDGLYGFAVEEQADAYAARFEGADRGTLQILDAAAGARLLAEPDDTGPDDTEPEAAITNGAVENAAGENAAERAAAPTGRATKFVQLPVRTQFRVIEDRLADMTDGSFPVAAFEVFDHPEAIVADGVTARRHGVDPGSALGVWFLGEPDAVRQHLYGHGWTHYQDLASRGRDERA
ncbi:hypothetical protein BJF78_34690 [Pseudonocardia sp. CNS-139]|nr:hypothetical protein BJF78_34690 [Pseudonocardia sp. CNS-139]